MARSRNTFSRLEGKDDDFYDSENYQPDTENPHVPSVSDEELEIDDETIVEAKESLGIYDDLSEFDEEPGLEYLMINAAWTCKKLTQSYEENGHFLVAEKSPAGFTAVAYAAEGQMYVDQAYDPDESAGNQMFDLLNEARILDKVSVAVQNYETMDLANKFDVSSLEEFWDNERADMAEAQITLPVAPGLEDLYMEVLEEQFS